MTAPKALVGLATSCAFIAQGIHTFGAGDSETPAAALGFRVAAVLLPIGFLTCLRAGLTWWWPARYAWMRPLGRGAVGAGAAAAAVAILSMALTGAHSDMPRPVATTVILISVAIAAVALLGPGIWAAWGMSTHPRPPGFTRKPRKPHTRRRHRFT